MHGPSDGNAYFQFASYRAQQHHCAGRIPKTRMEKGSNPMTASDFAIQYGAASVEPFSIGVDKAVFKSRFAAHEFCRWLNCRHYTSFRTGRAIYFFAAKRLSGNRRIVDEPARKTKRSNTAVRSVIACPKRCLRRWVLIISDAQPTFPGWFGRRLRSLGGSSAPSIFPFPLSVLLNGKSSRDITGER